MKRVLYLGLRPPLHQKDEIIVHYPVIKIVPIAQLVMSPEYTHIILTSQSAVEIVLEERQFLEHQVVLSVGQATTQLLEDYGVSVTATANPEQAEGIIQLLQEMDLSSAFVFWPHSSRSRPLITDYLEERGVKYEAPILYETYLCQPTHSVCLDNFSHIVFTSPSTVDGFLEIFGELPSPEKICCIGEVTRAYLSR